MKEHLERISPWDEDAQLQNFLGGLDLSLTRVIQLGGRDVGFITVTEDARELFLRQISILPRAQGKGVGEAVVRRLLDLGSRRGKPVGLLVYKKNRARRLYERLGFVVVEETSRDYRMRWSPPRSSGGRSSGTR